jgi:hypothetical protein
MFAECLGVMVSPWLASEFSLLTRPALVETRHGSRDQLAGVTAGKMTKAVKSQISELAARLASERRASVWENVSTVTPSVKKATQI